MREILFRGKRVDNGEWVEGFYTEYSELWTGAVIETDNDDFPVDPSTVGQYTGLCDKNGKKIFEGDVVICQEYECMGDIAYHCGEAGFIFRVYDEGYPSSYELECLCDFVDEMDVVGNIHDNPELVTT